MQSLSGSTAQQAGEQSMQSVSGSTAQQEGQQSKQSVSGSTAQQLAAGGSAGGSFSVPQRKRNKQEIDPKVKAKMKGLNALSLDGMRGMPSSQGKRTPSIKFKETARRGASSSAESREDVKLEFQMSLERINKNASLKEDFEG